MNIELTEEEMGIIGRTFAGPSGRKLRDMLEQKFCNRQSFDPDPLTMAFKEGQRSLALALVAGSYNQGMVDVDHPDTYVEEIKV